MSFFGSPSVINALWICAGGALMGFGWCFGGWLWSLLARAGSAASPKS